MTTTTMTNELFSTWENITPSTFFKVSPSSIGKLVHLTSAREIENVVFQQCAEGDGYLYQAQFKGHPIFVKVYSDSTIWMGDDEDNLAHYGEL